MYHNLDRCRTIGLAGIVVLGSNGEIVFLSIDEKLKLVKDVIGHFNKDKKIISKKLSE